MAKVPSFTPECLIFIVLNSIKIVVCKIPFMVTLKVQYINTFHFNLPFTKWVIMVLSVWFY